MHDSPVRRGRWWRRIILLAASVLFAAALSELVLRLLTTEEQGQPRIWRTKLAPLELVTTEQLRFAQEGVPSDSYFAPDPTLGWTIRPGARDKDSGLYASNSLGLRSLPREDPPRPQPGTTRILAVGDSFTHGDEVPYTDTWTHRLEGLLGPGHEVLNAGVSGYGTDQAVLRWRSLGAGLQPRIAILGIILWDVTRNVNVFRHLEHPGSSFPFSKPRFVIEGDRLQLVNSPVIPVEEIPRSLESIGSLPVSRHERWYVPSLYESGPLDASRLARFLRSRAAWMRRIELHRSSFLPGSEAFRVTALTVKLFCDEVRAAGAEPLVVLIPDRKTVDVARSGKSPLPELLAEIRKAGAAPVVDLVPGFLQAVGTEDPGKFYVRGQGHLSAEGNEVIAELVAAEVRRIEASSSTR